MNIRFAPALVLCLFAAACGNKATDTKSTNTENTASATSTVASSAAPTATVAAAPAASSSTSPTSSSAQAPAAGSSDEEALISMIEGFVDVIAANQDNCPKLAVALKGFIDTNGAKLLALKAKSEAMTPAQKAEFQKKNKPRAMAVVAKLMPALQKCGNDKDVQKAMQSLPKM
jgi:hypothetical protein